MNRVLITGAAGTVGSALVKAQLSLGNLVCCLDHSEDSLFKLSQSLKSHSENIRCFLGDIRDKKRVKDALNGIDVVYHCAAAKHVEIGEYNPEELVKTNIYGTSNIINAAIDLNVDKVILTSSDKAVNPTSTMGASKLMAEKLTIAANNYVGSSKTKLSVVRFGNILNSNGSLLTVLKKLFDQNRPLTITDPNMTRYFLSQEEATDLCLFCEKNMIGGEIFIHAMYSCKVLDLAKAIYGEECKYEIIGTKAGEKIYEELVSETELFRTKHIEGQLVIIPEATSYFPEKVMKGIEKYNSFASVESSIRSDSKSILLNVKQIKNTFKGI